MNTQNRTEIVAAISLFFMQHLVKHHRMDEKEALEFATDIATGSLMLFDKSETKERVDDLAKQFDENISGKFGK